MHHIVHCIDCVPFCVAGICPLSIDVIPMMWSLTLMKTQCYLQKCQASKTPLFIPIKSHSLAPALFYCIRTTTIQLLHAAVVEPLSSAWPVIATVNRWNPLAWVGVVWALLCLLIHACLSCLLLLRVESGLIHRGWIRGVWTCPTVCELSVWTRFGKGSGERPCRSTWWVVSLQPSSGTEFCVCDPWFSYYHALGPKPMDPLGFLITLVLCPGVASSFWCL